MTHFIGSYLIHEKRQDFVVLSTTEERYVAYAFYHAQNMWIKQPSEVLRMVIHTIPLVCGVTSALTMATNIVHHKRTKHIYVRNEISTCNCVRSKIKSMISLQKL